MSDRNYRDDSAVQSAIHNVFVGSAPERTTELGLLWEVLFPTFQLMANDRRGERFVMEAGAYRYVRFNHRAVRAFWLAGYAAWEGYRAVAESPTLESVDLTRFSQLLSAFDVVISSDKPEEEALPDGVPEPGTYPDKNTDPEGRAAAELATIAVGWTLLHELCHIKLQQAGMSAEPNEADPTKRRQEESECDLYATRFLLEQIDAYANVKKVDPARVTQKRQLGIYFALFALTLLSRHKWEASNTHPAVRDRIKAVRSVMMSQQSEIADAIAHTAFAALWPRAPGPFFE